MTARLDPNTAATLQLGPFRAIADGSLQDGLTILETDIRLSRDGGAWAAKAEATAPENTENGWYTVELDATDVGASGRLKLSCQPATSLGAWEEYDVSPPPLSVQDVADAMRLTPTGPVNDDSVDDKLDTIIATVEGAQDQEALANAGSATLGSETGTFVDTQIEDGTYWIITSVAAGSESGLTFNIGTAGESPTSLRIWGRFNATNGHQIMIQAYNFAGGGYENLEPAIPTSAGDNAIIRALNGNHVRKGQSGAPGVDGDVLLRFLYNSSVSGKVGAGNDWRMDKVSVFYSYDPVGVAEIVDAIINANPQRNYPFAAIHVDTESGQPGQEFGINGTPGNASNNLTDALALARDPRSGYRKLIIEGDSLIQLDQALPNWTFTLAQGSTIDLNGQDVDNCTFEGGFLTGEGTAATVGIRAFRNVLKNLTIWGRFSYCTLPDAGALTANGNKVFLLDCRSTRPGQANPTISGGNVAGLSMTVSLYGGGVDISGLANDAQVTLSGSGSYSFTDAASTGSAIVSSTMRQIGGLPTGFTLEQEARITQTTPMTIIADAVAELEAEPGITWNQTMQLINASQGGKSDGAQTTTFNLRNPADTKNRIQATTDGNGNRTAMTLDLD